ncbi:hypothetical protein Egran_04657 [Elaphomyces granulatus]|uniref:CorA-like transporter domain-containing protein n=1 Tax=Elaphomyces granulatus TaxID=519963 RepID=A0A232LU84_9EURO|nr:hypothetical protein Egran_04657 [Elaphomyces granulatus]
MAGCLDLGNDSFLEKINHRSHNLFQARDEQLEVFFISRTETSDVNKQTTKVTRPKGIKDEAQLEEVVTERSTCDRIYTIRQERSWTTLNISRQLFEGLLKSHDVFPHIWKVMFTFGRKVAENEYTFPAYRAHSSELQPGTVTEVAYVLRRAELKKRQPNPWSIRQTGVYHKISYDEDSKEPISTFILISPSPVVEEQMHMYLQRGCLDHDKMKPSNLVHQILVADSLSGWMDYMAWLEEQYREKFDNIMVSDIASKFQDQPPERYFSIEDRLSLSQLEESTTDLILILQTMVNNLVRIRDQLNKNCAVYCGNRSACSCQCMVEEYKEYIYQVEVNLNRAEVLRTRFQSTAKLGLDILNYEEATILREVGQASRQESTHIAELTATSARDATAVKILTIIGVIFLPTTIVTGFFSTQFVHLDNSDKTQISAQVWIIFAVSVPLTAITFMLWWVCVRSQASTSSLEKTAPCSKTRFSLASPISWLSTRTQVLDLESGTGSPTEKH